jgi:hypothetical protein
MTEAIVLKFAFISFSNQFRWISFLSYGTRSCSDFIKYLPCFDNDFHDLIVLYCKILQKINKLQMFIIQGLNAQKSWNLWKVEPKIEEAFLCKVIPVLHKKLNILLSLSIPIQEILYIQ